MQAFFDNLVRELDRVRWHAPKRRKS